jgi:hypothetical protein
MTHTEPTPRGKVIALVSTGEGEITSRTTDQARDELGGMLHMGDLERSGHHRAGAPDYLRWLGRRWHGGLPRGVCHMGTGSKGWRSRGESL